MEERSINIANAETILGHIEYSLQEIQQCVPSDADLYSVRQTIKKIIAELSKFEDNPKLMDPQLETLVLLITLIYLSMKKVNHTLVCSFAEIFYQLTKIRGYKFVVNFCSNDIYIVPELLIYINEEHIDKSDYECFMLLLWLSRLAIVPFSLLKIVPCLENDLFRIGIKFLTVHSSASKTQIGSLYLLASLLMRLDCVSFLNEYISTLTEDWVYKPSNEKVGHLLVINQLMKSYSNSHISHIVPQIHSSIIDYDILQLRYNGGHQFSTVHVLYLIKVLSKLARYYVQENHYGKVADIVNSILIDIMDGMGGVFDTKLRECTAKNMTKIVAHLRQKALNYSSQLTWFMVDQLNIPSFPSDHKFHRDLLFDSSHVQVDKYHTALLFLGFSALGRNINIEFMPTILSIVHQTLFISETRFHHVRGTQIRDASCFCIWSLFKKLSHDSYAQLSRDNPEMMMSIFADLLRLIIFDSDFTIRRCGIAVLQEFVGRFGSHFFQGLLPGKNLEEIGDFSIKLIERFSAGAVGKLDDSHKLIYELHSIGFPKLLFIDSLMEEVISDRNPFEARKLGGIYLAGILKRHLSEICLADFTVSQRTVDSIANDILEAYLGGNNECLFSLAEFSYQGLLNNEIHSSLVKQDQTLHFDYHYSSSERAESILHWINSLLTNDAAISDSYLCYVLSLSLARLTPGLRSKMKAYFQILGDNRKASLAMGQFEDVCEQITRGNQLLAEGIMCYPFNEEQLDLILFLMEDFNIDLETRSLLIAGAEHLISNGHTARIIEPVLKNLDDYTVTNQGDVGQKLRSACLSLLQSNLEIACYFPPELRAKLVRLSGESMDRLRVDSFRLICAIDGTSEYEENYSLYMSNYSLFFQDLFDYYRKNAQNKEDFWRGVVHSAGALTGSNMLINASVHQVLKMIYHSSDEEVNEAIAILFRLLKLSAQLNGESDGARYHKTVNCTLNLIGKIFDAEVKLPTGINYEALYVRAFNLHISGVNLKRMGLVLKIFQHMSTSGAIAPGLQRKCRQRTWWLACCHKNAMVRGMASKTLFEIVNDLSPADPIIDKIDTTDWFGESNDAKLQLERKILAL